MDVSLKLVAQGEPIPLVTNLFGVLFSDQGEAIELGQVLAETHYQSTYSTAPNAPYPVPSYLVYRGTLEQLALLETVRAANPPHFQIQLWGEIAYLLASQPTALSSLRAPPFLWNHGNKLLEGNVD